MRPLPSDNVDEVFIFNVPGLLEGGVPRLRDGLQGGQITTVVRSPDGDEAPGPSRAFWKSAAGETALLGTGWARVLKPHPLVQAFIEGHVFVDRAVLRRFGSVATAAPDPRLPDHLSPYLLFMLQLSRDLEIGPGREPKKVALVATIRDRWPDELGVCSDNLAEAMATLLRDPGSRGRSASNGKRG